MTDKLSDKGRYDWEEGDVVFEQDAKVAKGDFIQDPETGRFMGSHPGGGKDEGGETGGTGPKAVDFKPGVRTSLTRGFKDVKTDWFAKSPFKPDDIEGTMAAAAVAQKELASVGAEIGKKLGVKFVDPGTKSDMARIKEKAAERGGVHRVSDLSRAGFIIDSPEKVEAIAVELAKHFEVAVEDWKVTPVKYADRSLQLRFKNGTVGEIQMLDPKMYAAKNDKGHKLYKEQQKLDPAKDKAKIDALEEEMRGLYDSVLRGYSPSWRAALRRP